MQSGGCPTASSVPPFPGRFAVLLRCAPEQFRAYIRINRTAHTRPTRTQGLCCTICNSVKSGAQKSAVTPVVLAPPARHNRGSPAKLYSAQTFEAGNSLSVTTDGIETNQSSAHAQPTAAYAERAEGIMLHKSASVAVLLQWPLLDVMAKFVASCISASMQHQTNHDISVISSVNQGTVDGRID